MIKQLTDEAMFVIPFINISDINFVNIFSEDQNKPFLDKQIFIVHTANDAVDLYKLENHYKNQKGFLKQVSYRIEGTFYNVFIFELDSILVHYYELFVSNNHKDIPKDIIWKIIMYWNIRGIGCSIFDKQYKGSYIPHSDYIEDIGDKLLNQFYHETNISFLDIECTTE